MISDLFGLHGQVALVTGASSGLGAHFALTLSAAGADVVLAARRIDKLEAVAGRVRALGRKAFTVVMDVTDTASVDQAFGAAQDALGPITILVNNAGVPAGTYFTQTSDEEWRRVLDVNLDGVFRVGREGARRMQANKTGGAIINVASIIGLGALKTLTAYMASKAAVLHLTKGMALELARDNIRVNALAPGYISTELNAAYLAGPDGQKLLARVPMRRAGTPEELDGPLLLLASRAGALITGTVIVADGGHLLTLS